MEGSACLYDMSPGAMPEELCEYGKLTPMEAMILALVHPVIRVYKVRGYKGGKVHIINFPQNPRLLQELPVVILHVRNPNQNQDAPQQRLKDFELSEGMDEAYTYIFFPRDRCHLEPHSGLRT